MATAHETIFNAINGVYRDPQLSLTAANAVLEALTNENHLDVDDEKGQLHCTRCDGCHSHERWPCRHQCPTLPITCTEFAGHDGLHQHTAISWQNDSART